MGDIYKSRLRGRLQAIPGVKDLRFGLESRVGVGAGGEGCDSWSIYEPLPRYRTCVYGYGPSKERSQSRQRTLPQPSSHKHAPLKGRRSTCNLTMPRSRPQTTSVFSRSSASSVRRIMSSATEENRTAVDQRSSDGDVSSRGARKKAGQ